MTHSFSRRVFLTSVGAVAMGGLAAKALGLPQALADIPSSDIKAPLKGKAHIIGVNYPAGTRPTATSFSDITTIDLASGQVRHTTLPMIDGHAALPLGGGRVGCIAHHANKTVVVDSEHAPISELIAPEGYLFGGHGQLIPGTSNLIIPVRHAKPMTPADKGLFLVYDRDTLQKLDQVESAALHPHEIRYLPEQDEIVATHYGDIEVPNPPYRFNVVDARLVVYDAKTLKEKRSYPQNDFNAMLTHMSVTPDGYAYCVLTQYINVPTNPALPLDQNYDISKSFVTQTLGRPPEYEILMEGVKEGRIAMPLPFLRINTQTGEREELMSRMNDQIRSQSVAVNQQTGTGVAAYFHSNTIVLHRAGEKPLSVSGTKLGIEGISGVCQIPETPYIIISGSQKNSIVVNVNTLDVIARFESQNDFAPHVEFEPA